MSFNQEVMYDIETIVRVTSSKYSCVREALTDHVCR